MTMNVLAWILGNNDVLNLALGQINTDDTFEVSGQHIQGECEKVAPFEIIGCDWSDIAWVLSRYSTRQ